MKFQGTEIESFLRRDKVLERMERARKINKRIDWTTLTLLILGFLFILAYAIDNLTNLTTVTPIAHADEMIVQSGSIESFCRQAKSDHKLIGEPMTKGLVDLCK